MANSQLTQYRMKGNLNTPPYQVVVWYSFNTPDFTGSLSGYPVGTVINIAIDGQPIILNNTTQYNNPTGNASGDLGGMYPAPTVIGIDGYEITNSPTSQNEILSVTSFNPPQLSWIPFSAGVLLAGDVIGPGELNEVQSIQGVVISGPAGDGYVLTASSPTAASWVPVAEAGAGGQVVISTNYQVLGNGTDNVINVTTLSAPITITLPISPFLGETHTINDRVGDANHYNITIITIGNIDGYGQVVLNQPYQSITLVWCSTRWMITAATVGDYPTSAPYNYNQIIPPYSDNIRAIFDFSANTFASDANIEALIQFCVTNKINTVVKYVWGLLDLTHWTIGSELAFNKGVTLLADSGIECWALLGSAADGYSADNTPGCGTSQQWVMQNYIMPLKRYNQRAGQNKAYPRGAFTGLSLDFEWWDTPSYVEGEPRGVCDLIKGIRKAMPGMIISHQPTWGLLYGTDGYGAPRYIDWYDGYYGQEGSWLLQVCDYVFIQTYGNTLSNITTRNAEWFSTAQLFQNSSSNPTGMSTNCRIINCVIVQPVPSDPNAQTFWTGSAGAITAMEAVLQQVSNYYNSSTVGNQLNITWAGHCITPYQYYQQMQV